MSRRALLGLGLILVTGLGVVCANVHRAPIEAGLTVRSRAALAAEGIPIGPMPEGVFFEGRNALLRGYEGSPLVSDRAAKIVQDTYGVFMVSRQVISRQIGSRQTGSRQITERPIDVRPQASIRQSPVQTTLSRPAQNVQAQLGDILNTGIVEFQTNSAILLPRGQETLDKIAAVLQRAPNLPIEISGHTDSTGDPAYNMKLSRMRADACLAYLGAKGIPVQRMTAVGYGAERPLASNETPEGKQRNRRIEVNVKEAVNQNKEPK